MVQRQLDERTLIIGTAHVSRRSVEEVTAAIRERRPEQVLVELDARRLEALQDPERWKSTDIIKVLKEKKQHMFLLQLVLANMQARIGAETGVSPGSELLAAVTTAEEVGAEVVLIDRDVSITLKRGFAAMGFWARARMFWNLWMDAFTPAPADQKPIDIEAILETDAITALTDEFAKYAPAIKVALIDERDDYMASHIRDVQARGRSLVAVVGAGHLAGIEKRLASEALLPARADLDTPPPRRLTVMKVVGYAVPLAVIAGFAWMLATGKHDAFLDNALYWTLANGGLAAIGAFIALGHPLSALAAFVAAPITSLNPTLAAGWFAGLTEAKVRTPKVGDFEAIKTAANWKEFYRNPVIRVLLVTALANVGSMIGTYLGLAKIIRTFAGA
jgi:pheromone shutdown-related protein TraB